MYSDALHIMDQNTVKYMIDELKAELSAQKAAVLQKDSELMQKDAVLLQKDSEIERLRTQLAKYEVRANKEYSG